MFSTYNVLLIAIALELYCLFGGPGKEVRMVSMAISLYAVYMTVDQSDLAASSNLPGIAVGAAAGLSTFARVKLPVSETYVHGMLLGVLAQQASARSGMSRMRQLMLSCKECFEKGYRTCGTCKRS